MPGLDVTRLASLWRRKEPPCLCMMPPMGGPVWCLTHGREWKECQLEKIGIDPKLEMVSGREK